MKISPAAQALIDTVRSLVAKNRDITKAGGFFTPEQVANEAEAHRLQMRLRFDHNVPQSAYTIFS